MLKKTKGALSTAPGQSQEIPILKYVEEFQDGRMAVLALPHPSHWTKETMFFVQITGEGLAMGTLHVASNGDISNVTWRWQDRGVQLPRSLTEPGTFVPTLLRLIERWEEQRKK